MKFFFCSIVLFLFTICNNLFAQSKPDDVMVLPLKITVPANAKKLGAIRVGNNATSTHCDYEGMIASAKEKARALGGNLVKITQLIDPAFISKCYSIKADVYYADKLPDYHVQNGNTNDAGAHSSYATLYIYRLADTLALVTGYKVHLNNDSVICTVESKSRDSINIFTAGPVTLWAETERRQELKIDVKPGNDYYVRCGLVKGEIRMVPVLQLVSEATGAARSQKMGKKKKSMDVKYLQQVH